jgi:glycosyltransferase involved in cell wall biosynthesis
VSADQQLALYRSAKAFLFPSAMEGFGFAPVEAMACGTPAIVSDRGSLPEVVEHRRTGFVLSIDQGPLNWVETMESMVRDEVLHRFLGDNASRLVQERFTWAAAARDAAAFFQRIIKQREGR